MQRRNKIGIAIVAGCLIAAGAWFWMRTPFKGNTVFRDAAGTVVATAHVQIPESLPGTGQTFEGGWHLIWSSSGFPADATRDGTYRGNVDADQISIDLNPRMADNNVVFGGSTTSDPIAGTWYYATIAGGKSMGTFTLTR